MYGSSDCHECEDISKYAAVVRRTVQKMRHQYSGVLFVDTFGRRMVLIEVLACIITAVSRGLGQLLLSVGVTFNPCIHTEMVSII